MMTGVYQKVGRVLIILGNTSIHSILAKTNKIKGTEKTDKPRNLPADLNGDACTTWEPVASGDREGSSASAQASISTAGTVSLPQGLSAVSQRPRHPSSDKGAQAHLQDTEPALLGLLGSLPSRTMDFQMINQKHSMWPQLE